MTATRRHVLPLLLALVAAVGLLATPVGPTAAAAADAARPDLSITSSATYDVQPDQQRVRVTVNLTLTNHLKDTATRRFYFDEAFLAVLPDTSGYRLTTGGSGTPRVRVQRRHDDYTLLRLDLPTRLYSGRTMKLRLTFNLNDPGGAPTRDLRIGDSLASFPVWAYATEDTPGSQVQVIFPEGYQVRVEAGDIPSPDVDEDGRTIFRSGKLEEPLDFFAYLVADRPGAYAQETVRTTVEGDPVSVLVRSWPDDPPWAERVTTLLRDGLPEMGERIGLPWPHEEQLTVQEAVSRSIGGYAGLFDPREGTVEIAYYADDFVILHEAAHGWFNGTLLADRWANEAFASYYATEVAAALDVEASAQTLTDELREHRIPLNGWGPVGSEEPEQEDYAYAASLEVARLIAERAGEEGLEAVWADAAAGVVAYQPPGGSPETVQGVPDWRGLLDLLEANTDETYDDLWRTWIARPADVTLLDARAEARDQLDEVLSETDGWDLPRPIRDAMRAWRFADATALLDGATAALEQRVAVETAAAEAGLIVPDAMRGAFEDDDGFDDALSEAAAELETIGRYQAAVALRPAEITPVVALGLWGETPEADLVASRDALARGDLEASVRASAEAAVTWSGAEGIGQGRALSLFLLAVAAAIGVGLLLSGQRRRRRRRGPVAAGPSGPADPAGPATEV